MYVYRASASTVLETEGTLNLVRKEMIVSPRAWGPSSGPAHAYICIKMKTYTYTCV